jgi:hypothetical protein
MRRALFGFIPNFRALVADSPSSPRSAHLLEHAVPSRSPLPITLFRALFRPSLTVWSRVRIGPSEPRMRILSVAPAPFRPRSARRAAADRPTFSAADPALARRLPPLPIVTGRALMPSLRALRAYRPRVALTSQAELHAASTV